jgi:hypothetical protein
MHDGTICVIASLCAVAVLACSGVDDPCGEAADPHDCGCASGTGLGSMPTISLPNHGFDAVRVRMIGPETYTLHLTLSSGNWEAAPPSMIPGTYTFVAEGFVAGETAYFASVADVTIVACEQLEPVTVPLTAFQPAGLDLTTTSGAITATWSAVAQAQYYLVEYDSTSAFLAPSTDSVQSTSHGRAAAWTGWYHVRVRAGHALVAHGRVSDPDSVFVSASTARRR